MPGCRRQLGDSNVHPVGFSLLELVMVMAIIAVMAAIATPRFGAAQARYRADLAARRIAADIAYARSVARRNSTRQAIAFDVTSDCYELPDVNDVDHSSAPYTVVLSDTQYGVDLVSASFENANGYIATKRISFNMWGRPQSGNPLEGHPLAPLVDGSVVIALGSESRTIRIAPVTGTVSIQ